MSTADLRSIQALCEQRHDRDAQYLVREHVGQAQILGREIDELAREHKEYLKLLERFDFKIANAASPIPTGSGSGFRGSIDEQEKKQQRAQAELSSTFANTNAKLNEMHGRLSAIAIGINALRG